MFGIVDVGGGERGVYGAGVFDYCIEQQIEFDYCIGVSAGSANAASYISQQLGRNYAFYSTYSFRPEYMGIRSALFTGEYANLEYIYGTLSNSDGEYPLDWKAVEDSSKRLVVVTTDSDTALPAYFEKDSMSQDDYCAIKASSSLPLVSKPYPVNGKTYYDGGLSDPIPVRRAFHDGCEKVVVILTRPRDYFRSSSRDIAFARFLKGRYPRVAEALCNRASLYNMQLKLLYKYEQEGKVLILAPDTIANMDTLTKDKDAINMLYAKGLRDAYAIDSFLG